MKAGEVSAALATMYAEPAYAFFPQVRNGTGYARRSVRTADGVAMSLWPSRGLLLHGFEIKVSRSDWLAEMREPSKADEIARYCDRWWLVVGDPAIVEPGELPGKWGLIIPEDRPRRSAPLRVAREAEALDATPIDRLFLASMLREGRRGLVPAASVAEAAGEEVRKARDALAAERQQSQDRQRKANAYDVLRATLDDFERASGVRVTAYDGHRIGEVVRVVLESGIDAERLVARLASVESTAAGVVEEARRLLAVLIKRPPDAEKP